MGKRVERLNQLKKDKKNNKTGRLKYVIIGIVAFLILIGCGVFGYVYMKLNLIGKVALDKSKINISDEAQQLQESNSEITNIALYGIDSRDQSDDDNPRSDSIMILTIDRSRNKIKISSIVRDSYVNIPGRGMDKITHAYHFGGPELAVSTINNNFGLAIKDFMSIDFFGMAKVVDSIGGVDLDIQSDEIDSRIRYNINFYINEISNIENVTPKLITSTGKQTVNGIQAVAYARVRYTEGGDFKRTERQRILLNTIFNKVKTMDKTQYLSLVTDFLPNVKTSMSSTDLISLSTEVLSSSEFSIDQMRFPLETKSAGKTINGVYYYVTDLESAKKAMQDYIYKDIKPN